MDGVVTNVTDVVAGSELVKAVKAYESGIWVANTDEFDSAGGQLLVDSEIRTYGVPDDPDLGPLGTPVFDYADRADENPLTGGGRWVTEGLAGGQLKLVSDQILSSAASGTFAGSQWVPTYQTPVDFFYVFKALSYASQQVQFMFDSGSTRANGYICSVVGIGTPGTQVKLFKRAAFVDTQLGSTYTSTFFLPGDRIGFSYDGTNLKAWGDFGGAGWTLLFSVADATYAGSTFRMVLMSNDPGFILDRIGGGNPPDADAISAGAGLLEATAPFTSAHANGQPVTIAPTLNERLAYFTETDDQDAEALAARVPHSLYDKLIPGIRDPSDTEVIEALYFGDELVVTDVLRRSPRIDLQSSSASTDLRGERDPSEGRITIAADGVTARDPADATIFKLSPGGGAYAADQAPGDHSTKPANTKYVDDAITAAIPAAINYGTVFPIQGLAVNAAADQVVGATNDWLAMPCLILQPATITGIRFRVGATNGSASVAVALYSRDGQTKHRGSGGVTLGTALGIQSVPFTSTVALPAGLYWLLACLSNTTGQIRGWGSAGFLGRVKQGNEGSFAVPNTFTPPADTTQATQPFLGLSTY